MTIRHQCEQDGCYKSRLPDWGILDGCFPRGIKPSDVDGIVEINGWFLMLEWKPLNGFLSTGQRLMFQNITANAPKGQALIIFGDKDVPSEIELWQRGKRQFRQRCDLAFLSWFCQQWGIFADRKLPSSEFIERRFGPRRSIELGQPSQLLLAGNTRRLAGRRSKDSVTR